MLSEFAIFERVIDPERGGLSPELSRYILSLDFPTADHARYRELSRKASEGGLTDAERAELDEHLNVNDFLTLIKAKAQAFLKRNDPAA